MERLPNAPSGAPRSLSTSDMKRMVDRLAGAVEMEQDLTLTPWESWVLLRMMARLQHNAKRR